MMDDLPLRHNVEYEISRLLRRVRVRAMAVIEEIHPDLDYAAYLLMIAIYESHDPDRVGVRATELAATIGVHKSTVSRGLGTLERLGLVVRVGDPTDRRARLVALDQEAVRRLEALREQRYEWLAQAVADWDAEDLSRLAELLHRLNAGFETSTV